MNKTNNKKSKVDKCPSTFTQENKVKDVSKKCIINEKLQEKNELKNGLVNGIVNDSANVKKSSRRNKKNKHTNSDINGEYITDKDIESNCRPDENCIGKTAPQTEIEDQSSKSLDMNSTTQSDNIVNNIDKHIEGSKKKKCKLGKLDSNDNISTNVSCDKKFPLEPQIAKKSTNNDKEDSGLKKIVDVHSDSEINDTTVSSVLEVADSLRNVQLEDNSENSEIHSISKTKPKIDFIQYESELQMPMIMKIIQKGSF
ncbi:hypothetical protein NQ314_016886 [Rhamnusium bicolor]|uniref:Uncharacterized protein n=1 Tax=Rhamnusium bicolor TaxID=1586634 RepID=A0AAV8WVY6_9CUCU|nr:hypothetical protein NQ314_016886 [Rhamnusium bicolor]